MGQNENSVKLPWYKNTLIVLYIMLFIGLITFFNQCSVSNKLGALQQQNVELTKSINQNTESIKNFESIVKTTIELQFTQNLLYNDAINKKQMSTEDIQKRFNDLTKKLNEQKKVK